MKSMPWVLVLLLWSSSAQGASTTAGCEAPSSRPASGPADGGIDELDPRPVGFDQLMMALTQRLGVVMLYGGLLTMPVTALAAAFPVGFALGGEGLLWSNNVFAMELRQRAGTDRLLLATQTAWLIALLAVPFTIVGASTSTLGLALVLFADPRLVE